jgi:superfamily II DNA or RNA helicase
MNLWTHQLQALENLKKVKSYALHMDPGTGKTAVAVKWIEGLLHTQEHKVLIFTPPVVCAQWKQEFERFTQLCSYVVIATGSSKKKIDALKSGKSIVVTNYEGVRSKDVLKALIEFSPTILVCDESHRVKSPSAMQSKEIAKLSRLCLYRLNMTGTPMTNSELDLFQQFYILDGGATFGNNFYCVPWKVLRGQKRKSARSAQLLSRLASDAKAQYRSHQSDSF